MPVKQSEMRAAGRARAAVGGRLPASFGRAAEEGERREDFTIRGGESFHLVLHVDVTPDPDSLAALRAAVREATLAGVLDGYAAALQLMDDPDADADGAGSPGGPGSPGGAHGGAPPGEPQGEVDGCG